MRKRKVVEPLPETPAAMTENVERLEPPPPSVAEILTPKKGKISGTELRQIKRAEWRAKHEGGKHA